MARMIIFTGGPKPGTGRLYCPFCVMLAKREVIRRHEDQVSQANAGSATDPPLVIPVGDMTDLHLDYPVTRGISTVMPNMGFVEVCWTHVLGVEPMPGGLMPGTPEQAAALQGAVVLGNNRRQ